jgi:hypothetical protein
VACLTLGEETDAGTNIAHLARLVRTWRAPPEDDPLDDLLISFELAAPRTAVEALERWRAALAEVLADRRHAVVLRHKAQRRDTRSERLLALVVALGRTPMPQGRGAVGIDLEGRTTVLEGQRETLTWGVLGEAPSAVATNGDIDVASARRLLRACRTPANTRLDAAVDGRPGYREQAARWLSSALQLRTVRILLERQAQ